MKIILFHESHYFGPPRATVVGSILIKTLSKSYHQDWVQGPRGPSLCRGLKEERVPPRDVRGGHHETDVEWHKFRAAVHDRRAAARALEAVLCQHSFEASLSSRISMCWCVGLSALDGGGVRVLGASKLRVSPLLVPVPPPRTCLEQPLEQRTRARD